MAGISWRSWSIYIWPEDERAGCNYHGCVAKEMFHHDSRDLASWHIAKPRLAEPPFKVEVKCLKRDKYELGKISSFVVAIPLYVCCWWVLPTEYWMECLLDRRYSGMGILLAIRWRHTHIASPHVCTTFYVVGFWLLATWGSVDFYRQPWCCYSLRSQWSKSVS